VLSHMLMQASHSWGGVWS